MNEHGETPSAPYSLQELFYSTESGVMLIEEFGFPSAYQGEILDPNTREIEIPIYEGCDPIGDEDPPAGVIALTVDETSWHLKFKRGQKIAVYLTGTTPIDSIQTLEAHQQVVNNPLTKEFVYLYQGSPVWAEEDALALYIGANLAEAFNRAYWEDYGTPYQRSLLTSSAMTLAESSEESTNG